MKYIHGQLNTTRNGMRTLYTSYFTGFVKIYLILPSPTKKKTVANSKYATRTHEADGALQGNMQQRYILYNLIVF